MNILFKFFYYINIGQMFAYVETITELELKFDETTLPKIFVLHEETTVKLKLVGDSSSKLIGDYTSLTP